jgi:hypothetical protein
MNTAKLITEITITDPDSNLPVGVAIYKDLQSGGIFGVDSSYVEQVSDKVWNPLSTISEKLQLME